MKIIARILFWLFFNLVVSNREPDQVIGDKTNPYLLRWWLFGTAKERNSNGDKQPRRIAGRCLYLHCFVRSDDDRAKHDHPWDYASLILRGPYIEHRDEDASDNYEMDGATEMKITDARKFYDAPVQIARTYEPGSLRFGLAETPHRIELLTAEGYDVYDELDHAWMPYPAFLSVMRNHNHPVWSLFYMGVWKRDWGFHCPQGWKHWREFTTGKQGNEIGAGCGEEDTRLRCYECNRSVPWLAPDSRCTTCTRCTAEEIF